MAIYKLGERTPRISTGCYLPDEATVIGDVSLGEHTNLWPGAVLRGDVEAIVIGPRCSIQDGAVLHSDPGCPLSIGADVTVGHQATVHGCTIGEGSLIGMQAILLNRSVIGRHCLVGAGALITEGKSFPDRSLIIGSPAKRVRDLTEEELENLQHVAERYVERAKYYREHLERLS